MNFDLLTKLKNWRSAQAARENVALYYILANKTLEDIAEREPQTKEALLELSGIGEKKFDKYGMEILNLVTGRGNPEDRAAQEIIEAVTSGETIFSVSTYLDLVNTIAREHFRAKVRGEIGKKIDERNGHYYFSIRDKADGSVLSCVMWSSVYKLCGVELKEGLEVIVTGAPDIYKPTGMFSFKIQTVELVGEGALKAAYEKLKAKLETEGCFDLTLKRPLPEFPHKIGLITSNKGDAIHDFVSNLGKYGYHIKFLDSRVEGQQAVKDLLEAVEYFKDKDIDVLVMIRGGGAWESLQAFNNEMLVRAVRAFPKPVLAGIGHEKDVTLVALAADRMVSTPTATAETLNQGWDRATSAVSVAEQTILGRARDLLLAADRRIARSAQTIQNYFTQVFQNFRAAEAALVSHGTHFRRSLAVERERLREHYRTMLREWERSRKNTEERITSLEKTLELNNPERLLALGYSIARVGTTVIKSVKDVVLGAPLDVRVSDGTIRADIVAFKNVNYERDQS